MNNPFHASQQLTLTLPPGPLGLGIQREEDSGHCFVFSKNPASNSPLLVKDTVISLNGIKLVDVEGGVDAWVKMFGAFADVERTVVVSRGAAAVKAAEKATRSLKHSAHNQASIIAPVNRPLVTVKGDTTNNDWAARGSQYRTGIITAITELKQRVGSSSYTIKKHMQDTMPPNKKWLNGMYLNALKKAVSVGDLVQNKGKYKLSIGYKNRTKNAKKAEEQAAKKKNQEESEMKKKKANEMAKKKVSAKPQMTIATTNAHPPARLPRVSLSPLATATAASAPANTFTFATNAAIAASASGRRVCNTAANVQSKNMFRNAKRPPSGHVDIAQKAAEMANAEYRNRIIAAMTKRSGTGYGKGSIPTIKKEMQATMNESMSNESFNGALKKMLLDGELVQDKSTYRLSAGILMRQHRPVLPIIAQQHGPPIPPIDIVAYQHAYGNVASTAGNVNYFVNAANNQVE
ncbi:hypothetical protein ACHAXR_001789, partial [Thalassiosira sp. AJA248-18]